MEVHMKRTALLAIGILAVSSVLLAQGRGGGTPAAPPALELGASQADVDKALVAAPANQKDQATVIKWKPDYTYETLRKGTNRLVCYDRSGFPQQQPFSVQCTSVANLDRVAQNLKAEATGDRKKSEEMLNAMEKDGTRVKPEYGPGPRTCPTAPRHDRSAGRHHSVHRPAGQSQARWCLDYECGDVDRAHHDTGTVIVSREFGELESWRFGEDLAIW
jgi:hypothetical protein